jgi:uncharacterized membrane protein YhaH (DUF805 family)
MLCREGERMRWFKSLFSWSGRASRSQYWLGWLFILFLFLLSKGLSEWLWLMAVLSFCCTIIWLVISTRRLHDLGLSGWWAFGVWTVAQILVVIDFIQYPNPNPELERGLGMALAILVIGGTIWLGSVKGQQMENRFGPPVTPNGPTPLVTPPTMGSQQRLRALALAGVRKDIRNRTLTQRKQRNHEAQRQ